MQRIHELESRVKHDVIAFTMSVGESIDDASAARWLHYGLTSNDVVDTAQALLVRDASRLIERGLTEFGDILALRAQEFRHTPQIGRTHGIHAEPITFGLKIANWYAENQRNQERFRNAAAHLEPGGCFVIEVGVPDLQHLPPGQAVVPFDVSAAEGAMLTESSIPSKWKDEPTIPDSNRIPPSSVPLFDPTPSVASPSPFHQLTRPEGAGTHLGCEGEGHFPAEPAL